MEILCDENLDGNIVLNLEINFKSVESIAKLNPGISDFEIIQLLNSHFDILITEDKDFGEWVFAHNLKTNTIIFLRYNKDDLPAIIKILIEELINFPKENDDKWFITITKDKIRRRKII